MGWLKSKSEKIKAQGAVPFFSWVFGKFLFGLGIAFLAAGAFPGYGWMLWGFVFIALGIVFSIPMLRAFVARKKY
jgi:hypothetical protein